MPEPSDNWSNVSAPPTTVAPTHVEQERSEENTTKQQKPHTEVTAELTYRTF